MLNLKLQLALKSKGASYKPRTRHLNTDKTPKFTNHLILESSPYLLQHAHNPVNWYSWNADAFKQAEETNKPIFFIYRICHLSLVSCNGRAIF